MESCRCLLLLVCLVSGMDTPENTPIKQTHKPTDDQSASAASSSSVLLPLEAARTRWAVIAVYSPDNTKPGGVGPFDEGKTPAHLINSALRLGVPPDNIIILARPGFVAKYQQACDKEICIMPPSANIYERPITRALLSAVLLGAKPGSPEHELIREKTALPTDYTFLLLWIALHGSPTNQAFLAANKFSAPVDVGRYMQGTKLTLEMSEDPKTGEPVTEIMMGPGLMQLLSQLIPADNHNRFVVTMVLSCYSGGLFNHRVHRLDEAKYPPETLLKGTKRDGKAALYDSAALTSLRNQLIITSAADYEPTRTWNYMHAVSHTLTPASNLVTWKDFIVTLQQRSRELQKVEDKDAAELNYNSPSPNTPNRDLTTAERPPEKHHKFLRETGKTKYFRVRAFGAPEMLHQLLQLYVPLWAVRQVRDDYTESLFGFVNLSKLLPLLATVDADKAPADKAPVWQRLKAEAGAALFPGVAVAQLLLNAKNLGPLDADINDFTFHKWTTALAQKPLAWVRGLQLLPRPSNK